MTDKELEKIYNEAYRAVYWTAMSLLKNEADAEDVVQDTFVTLIESYDTMKDKDKVIPWLKKIAANKCLNRLTRTKTDAVEDEFFDDVEAIAEDFLPDSIVESEEARRIIMDIINNKLSDEIRRTLILFYFDDMSTKEIAEALGVPEGTVRRRLNFARNKIKKEVEKYEEENDTKLFGMAIPFLTKLFIKESEQVVFKPMPVSLANLSASVKAPGSGAGIKASTEAVRKGTEIMKTKIIIGAIAAVVAVGVTVGIIAGVLNSKRTKVEPEAGILSSESVEDKTKNTTAETTAPKPKANKDLFVWKDNVIVELSEEGEKADVLVIPKECEGFMNIFDEGVYSEVYFESDDDINLNMAFSNAPNLKKIVLPKNLTTLNMFEFANDVSLEEIELPDSVTTLDSSVFQGCTSLKRIEIPEGVTELPYALFIDCSSLEEVTLHEGITTLGLGCFANCESLKTISLPSTVKTIEDKAFLRCRGLESVELNEGLESIGYDAFSYAESLTSLRVPSTVKSVQVSVLYGSGVTDLYLPAGLEITDCELASFYNPDAKTRIHVTAGSWADTHYDDYFVNCGEKTYD